MKNLILALVAISVLFTSVAQAEMYFNSYTGNWENTLPQQISVEVDNSQDSHEMSPLQKKQKSLRIYNVVNSNSEKYLSWATEAEYKGIIFCEAHSDNGEVVGTSESLIQATNETHIMSIQGRAANLICHYTS